MKKFGMIALALITSLAMVISVAGPVLACWPGYSPGWFKNHEWTNGTIFHPNDTYKSAFEITTTPAGSYLAVNPNLTLDQALRLGKSKGYPDGELAFLRQSVATLLNQRGDGAEIAFLRGLVQTVYLNKGGIYGQYGAANWKLSDWATWFDVNFNSLY